MHYDHNYIRSRIRFWEAQLDMAEQSSHEDSYRQFPDRYSNTNNYSIPNRRFYFNRKRTYNRGY